MIVRHPDDIDDPSWYPLLENSYHGGSVSPMCEAPPEDKNRRRIGFKMKDGPLEPLGPDWLLI